MPTTWALLVAMALYDLLAVLSTGGPLKACPNPSLGALPQRHCGTACGRCSCLGPCMMCALCVRPLPRCTTQSTCCLSQLLVRVFVVFARLQPRQRAAGRNVLRPERHPHRTVHVLMQVLVELAMEREEDIPALIYEARPVVRS